MQFVEYDHDPSQLMTPAANILYVLDVYLTRYTLLS